MLGLTGQHQCKLDAKGRFMLPSALRRQLDPSANEAFFLNRGFEQCLVMYPMNEWEKEERKLLDRLNLYDPSDREFYRKMTYGGATLSLDKNGRLLIPKSLLDGVGIKKEVVLFAFANRIEVWDAKVFDKNMNQGWENFSELAQKVMGNSDSNE